MNRTHHFISVIAGIDLGELIEAEDYDTFDENERSTPVDPDQANVVSSRMIVTVDTDEVWHAPVLDIDFPAQLVPSATEGHFHLYLDMPMRWSTYEALLTALAAAGVIEDGYARASIARGASFVRMPGVPKIGRNE